LARRKAVLGSGGGADLYGERARDALWSVVCDANAAQGVSEISS